MSIHVDQLAGVVPLVDICERYLGLGPERAAREALAGSLPLPVFRLRGSNKSPWLVRVEDLRAYIDTQASSAAREHAHIHG